MGMYCLPVPAVTAEEDEQRDKDRREDRAADDGTDPAAPRRMEGEDDDGECGERGRSAGRDSTAMVGVVLALLTPIRRADTPTCAAHGHNVSPGFSGTHTRTIASRWIASPDAVLVVSSTMNASVASLDAPGSARGTPVPKRSHPSGVVHVTPIACSALAASSSRYRSRWRSRCLICYSPGVACEVDASVAAVKARAPAYFLPSLDMRLRRRVPGCGSIRCRHRERYADDALDFSQRERHFPSLCRARKSISGWYRVPRGCCHFLPGMRYSNPTADATKEQGEFRAEMPQERRSLRGGVIIGGVAGEAYRAVRTIRQGAPAKFPPYPHMQQR